jgi:hypothetical protein
VIHSVLCNSLVKKSGATPGDFYLPKDCRRVYFAGADGNVVDITACIDGDIFRGISVALLQEVRALQDAVDVLVAQNTHAAEYLTWVKNRKKAQ